MESEKENMMNAFAQAISNISTTTCTENGDKAYTTSGNACLDLFAKIAAIRGQGASVAISAFELAYKENADIAARIALWARDVRGGAGERQVVRDILSHLEKTDTDRLFRLLPVLPEVGRWDDLFSFTRQDVKEYVFTLLRDALAANNGIAAKWTPRENSKTHKSFAREFREFLGLSPRQYRKMLVEKTNVVETQMCNKEWENINFSHVPSVASSRYSKAFWKHQADRYGTFIQKATKGEVKINASALFPYDCVKASVDELTANALWNQLPDFVPEGVSFMPIIDVSGSMTWTQISPGLFPIHVAVSLGIYLAERNKSAFKNLAMTFSEHPKYIKIPDSDSIKTKYNSVMRSDVGGSTNFDAAMNLILDTAVKNKVPQNEMPTYLLVMSDMEFNGGGYGYRNTSVAERTKESFKNAGYEMPSIVWWNIQSRNGTNPVRADERGMILVSGCSPAITKTVLTNKRVTPEEAMLDTIMVPRYDH